MKLFLYKFWPQIIIVALWLVFSFPYVFKGLVPFPSDYLVTFFPPWSSHYGMPVKNNAMPDVITQIYPWKKLTIETWKSGQVPLWNPYAFSGTPHAGNYQSAVFSPVNILFFILPFLDAWSVMILLQPLLAGLFMYMFVQSIGRSKGASLLSAVSFMFCGFIVVWMAYGTLGYAVLFLPLILWGVRRNNVLAVSGGVVLSLVSGHFQTSIYVIGTAVAYMLWNRQWKHLLSLLFGVCIAMPQVLLGYKSFAASTRSLAVVRGEIIPWQYLVTLIAPDFYGNPVTRNDWFGHYAEWAGFVGVTPLILAVVAMAGKKTKEIWFFTLLFIGTLLLALPSLFNDILYVLKIPVLSGSAASRIIVLASYSLTILAAFGLDAVIKNKKKILFLCIPFAIMWLVLVFGKPFPADKLLVAQRNFVIPSTLYVVTSVLLLFKKRRWAIIILLVLTAFDVLRFANKWMPFESRQYVYPGVPSLQFLSARSGVDRTFGNIGAGEVGVMHHIPIIEGYDAVYPARYGEFIDAVASGKVSPGARSVVQFDKNGLYKSEALQLLGIKYIYHRFSDGRNIWVFPYWEYLTDGSMKQIYNDGTYEIFQYNSVLPRVFLASSYTVRNTDKAIIDTLFAKEFDRANTLVLEEKPAIEPAAGSGTVSVLRYTPNKVVIDTESTANKLLFISDTFDKGWQVTIDGKRSGIYRADYDFRAVPVPAGKHSVVFDYNPAEFRWGIIIAGIGMIGVLLLRKKV